MRLGKVLLVPVCLFVLLLSGCGKNSGEPAAEEAAAEADAADSETDGREIILKESETGKEKILEPEASEKIEKPDEAETLSEEEPIAAKGSDEPEEEEEPLEEEEPSEEKPEPTREEDFEASEAIQTAGQDAKLPEDTVEYVESDEEEIMETRSEESEVDEDDPDTYRVVQKEVEVPVDKEVPEAYADEEGKIVYEYVDGVWYYYKYSSGEVTLDEQDEEMALFLLNLDGSYDDYEVQKIECREITEENSGNKYAYHVLYRKVEKLDGEPEDVDHLKVVRVRKETVTETVTVEEKVPVMTEHEVGTGTYVYHGWQELDGNTYYFDSEGWKVTGIQIIRGTPYVFDSEGVLQSSVGIDVSGRNGDIDWEKIKKAGVEFAMIRAGYRGCFAGMLIEDSRCTEYLEGAAKAGIETGVYFFSQAVTEDEAREEAGMVLEMISEYPVSMPVAIAVEYASGEYSVRADDLSVDERTACAAAFCREISAAGYMPVIYASEEWMSERLDMTALDDYEVWLVEYDADEKEAEPFEIWQYTNQGKLDGMNGNVNMDIRCGE